MKVWIVEYDGGIACFKRKESAIDHAKQMLTTYEKWTEEQLKSVKDGEQLLQVCESPVVWLEVLHANVEE